MVNKHDKIEEKLARIHELMYMLLVLDGDKLSVPSTDFAEEIFELTKND